MAGAIPPMIIELELKTTQLEEKLHKVEGDLNKLGTAATESGKHMGGLGEHVKHLVAGFLGFEAAKKAFEFVGESAKTAAEANKSFAVFDRQLVNTTGASAAQTEEVHKSIEAMGLQNGVISDTLLPTMATFIRATGDSNQALKLQQIALNVSAGTGKNATTVSLAMAKALTGNSSALQRLIPGIKNAKDQIGYLEKQFAGAAKIAADADPYQRMTVAFHDIQVAVGQAVLPILNQFTAWLTDAVPQIQTFFSELTDPTTEAGAKWKTFTDGVMAFFKGIHDNWSLIQAFIGGLVAYKVATIGINVAMAAYEGVMAIATLATEGFGVALASTGIGAIAIAVGVLTAGIIGLNSAMGGSDGNATGTKKSYEFLLKYQTAVEKSAKYSKIFSKAFQGYLMSGTADPNDPAIAAKALQKGYDAVQAAKTKAAASDKASAAAATALTQAQKDAAAAAAKAAADAAAAAAKAAEKARVAWVASVAKLGVDAAPLLEKNLGRIANAVSTSFGKFRDAIAKGFDAGTITAKAAAALQNYADKEETILSAIATKRDAIANKYDLAKTLIGSVSDSVKSMLDVGNLGTTATEVQTNLDSILKKVVEFGQNIALLKSKNVAGGLLNQLATAGVETGGALAAGLASATDEQLAAINSSYTAIQEASGSVAERVATAIYGDGVNTVKGLLKGIASQDAPLMKLAQSLGTRFSKAFSNAVNAASLGKSPTLPTITGYAPSPSTTTPTSTAPSNYAQLLGSSAGRVQNINVTNNVSTNASPAAIAQATVSSIKFGLPVTSLGHM